MVFSSKKNGELLTMTKSIRDDMDVLCRAVVDMFEKLESKLASLDTKILSLDRKLDAVGEDRRQDRRRSCCSNCTIS